MFKFISVTSISVDYINLVESCIILNIAFAGLQCVCVYILLKHTIIVIRVYILRVEIRKMLNLEKFFQKRAITILYYYKFFSCTRVEELSLVFHKKSLKSVNLIRLNLNALEFERS